MYSIINYVIYIKALCTTLRIHRHSLKCLCYPADVSDTRPTSLMFLVTKAMTKTRAKVVATAAKQ